MHVLNIHKYVHSYLYNYDKVVKFIMEAFVNSYYITKYCCLNVQLLSEEIKAKEKDFEEIKKAMGELGDINLDHKIHKTVRNITEQYDNITNNVKLRGQLLSQFKIRVNGYEEKVEGFTQWLSDYCKRLDELSTINISVDAVLTQLNDVEVSTFT